MNYPHQAAAVPAAAMPDESPALRWKAITLLVILVLTIVGTSVYILYARGVFERHQIVVLRTEDAGGVDVGMPLTFAGFSIGRITRISLGDDGYARLVVEVPERDAKWLRVSSVFTLERGLVGGTKIKAYSGLLEDPPLPDGEQRDLLSGDAGSQIPFIASAAKELLESLNSVTKTLQGGGGALELVMGNPADRQRVIQLLDRSDQLLKRLDQVTANADVQVFGKAGLMPQVNALMPQVNALVPEVRAVVPQVSALVPEVAALIKQVTATVGSVQESLKRVDGILADVQVVTTSTKAATVDLVTLRNEVEQSLQQVNTLLVSLQTKWPFAGSSAEVQLP